MVLVNPADWLSLTEAAAYLGLTKARVSVLVREGRIAHERVGRMIFIRRTDAEAFKKIPRPPGPIRDQVKPKPRRRKRG